MIPSSLRVPFAALAAAVLLPASLAQTAAHHPVTHRAATPTAAVPACVKLPEISAKVPALPTGVKPCVKALFTVDERLDYISPLVGPEIRQTFSNLPQIFTLGYIDTQVGTGEPAKPHMYYSVRYSGYLLDGTLFDATSKHPGDEPFPFLYGGHRVIPGWDMGFEGMRVGGKRRLFVPYQLAYGERGQPPTIPAKSMLIFDMELVKQTDPAVMQQEMQEQQKKEQEQREKEKPAATEPATPGTGQNPAGAATPTPATANPAAHPATDPTAPTTATPKP